MFVHLKLSTSDLNEFSPIQAPPELYAKSVEAQAIRAADYMPLACSPISDEIWKFVQIVSERIFVADLGKRDAPKTRYALACVLADLMRGADTDPGRYHYRSKHCSAFKGGTVGYKPFKRVVEGLEALGYLEVLVGKKDPDLFEGRGIATRMRLTPSFFSLAADHRIYPADWSRHFQPASKPQVSESPLVLRGQSSSDWWHKKTTRAKLMPLIWDDSRAQELAAQVNEINLLHAGVQLSADGFDEDHIHRCFFRGFNQGDTDGYGWNKGGRLYSEGGGFQQFSSKDRATIKINGEATCEIDISACHLTILHARNGIVLCEGDAYEIEGFPRAIIKACVTMTLGHSTFHSRWSPDVKKKLAEKKGINVSQYPIKKVMAAILEKYPLLQRWPDSDLRWGDFHFLESNVIVDCVHRLAKEHAVIALPVHDSIIVPASKVAIAKQILVERFQHHIGVVPKLKLIGMTNCN